MGWERSCSPAPVYVTSGTQPHGSSTCCVTGRVSFLLASGALHCGLGQKVHSEGLQDSHDKSSPNKDNEEVCSSQRCLGQCSR